MSKYRTRGFQLASLLTLAGNGPSHSHSLGLRMNGLTDRSVKLRSHARFRMRASKSAPVGVISKVLRILEALKASPAGLQLREIAEQTAINKSTAYRFLAHLELERYWYRDESGAYHIWWGTRAAGIGNFLSAHASADQPPHPARAMESHKGNSEPGDPGRTGCFLFGCGAESTPISHGIACWNMASTLLHFHGQSARGFLIERRARAVASIAALRTLHT
jgi:IclR helix-turn-helix domain